MLQRYVDRTIHDSEALMGSCLSVAQRVLPPVNTGEIFDIARFSEIFYDGGAVGTLHGYLMNASY